MGIVVFINLNDTVTGGGGGGGGGAWGTITGTLSAQTDLQAALNNKAALSHTHTKANITDFAHTHVKADITDFAHTHLWADITDKPLTFTPSTHTHTKANITDFAHTHLWADITDKPSTFTPSTHTHLWADITDKPVTFAPSAHSHAWGTITGTLSSQTDLQTALNAKAETLHTHTAANITSGVLALAQGGTGVVGTPTNGQLLIGNGSGYSISTLTAGTGIAITNGVGTITIASTITPGSAVWGSITGTLSSQTDLNSALAGKANSSHNHAATEITSGLLPVARGGTNIGTTPTNGQLLIGNGTGYAVANITAGSGITVTNGAGTITIAATASSVIGFTKTGTAVYAGELESIPLTSSGDGTQAYFLGTTGASIINGSVSRSGIFFSEASTLGGSVDVSTSLNMILGSSNCSIRTTTAGSTTNTFRRNSIISASSSNIYSGNSGITSVQNNVIIAGSNNRIGRSTANTYTISNHCMVNSSFSVVEQAAGAGIIEHTFIGTRHVTVSPFIGNSNVLWIGSDPARTTALALNDGPESGHVYNLAGRMSLMPISSKTPQLRFYQRVATGDTVLPSPYYHVNLTIDDTALTSNVTFQLPSSNGSSGQFLTTNGSGVTSWANVSLSEIALSQNTASPNNTVNATRILANAASTNADLVLQPKGTGALLAQLPDGTATGGNKRGTQSVDLQLSRTLNTEVAQGNYCGIVGGQRNTASGNYTFIAAGFLNNTSGSSQLVTGNGNAGSGNYSLITGSGNVCNGAFGFVIGNNNNLSSGSYITTIGQNNSSVQGDYAFVVGSSNSTGSSGSNVVIFGNSIGSNAGVTNVLVIGSNGQIPANSKTKIAVITGALACGTDYQSLTTDLTGASWSSLSSNAITMVNGQLMHYEINVVAVRGTDLAAYKITGVAFASGGSITLYDNVSTVVTEQGSATSWDARVSSSGLNLLIQGFGDVSGAVRWGATAIFTSSRT
jgi:hypothetical protein